MQLDSVTILVAGSAVLVLQGLGLLFFWWRDRMATWLLIWGLSFAVGGAVLPLYTHADWAADPLAVSFGNGARMVAVLALWQGLRVFQQRRFQGWLLAAVGVAWIVATMVPPLGDNQLARAVILSLVNSAGCALCVVELWHGRAENLPSRRPLTVLLASFSLIMLARAAAAPFLPAPIGTGAFQPSWLGLFMLVVFAHIAFAALLFFAMTRERREAEQRSFALADPLTGLLNRRAFGDFASRMDRRRADLRSPLALLMLDLDHFKLVNDRFGHEAGDRLLRAFAEVADECARASDRLFRMGGEEFCFVLPDTTRDEAIAVAERIRATFAATAVDTGIGREASATVSIGIAVTRFVVNLEVLLAAADAAVYEAKTRGRNRVVVAEPGAVRRPDAADVVVTRLSA